MEHTDWQRIINTELFNEKYAVSAKTGDMFRAFEITPLCSVKGIIIGQDPYPYGADGLAFSSNSMQASARRIFRCLLQKGLITEESSKCTKLDNWALQGLLMINTGFCLHEINIWRDFVVDLIARIVDSRNIFIIAWGAKAKEVLADVRLKTCSPFDEFTFSHPSPRCTIDFCNCPNFEEANQWLATFHTKCGANRGFDWNTKPFKFTPARPVPQDRVSIFHDKIYHGGLMLKLPLGNICRRFEINEDHIVEINDTLAPESIMRYALLRICRVIEYCNRYGIKIIEYYDKYSRELSEYISKLINEGYDIYAYDEIKDLMRCRRELKKDIRICNMCN